MLSTFGYEQIMCRPLRNPPTPKKLPRWSEGPGGTDAVRIFDREPKLLQQVMGDLPVDGLTVKTICSVSDRLLRTGAHLSTWLKQIAR